MINRSCILLLAVTLAVAGCSHAVTDPNAKPEGANLTAGEAIHLAERTAEREGFKLSEFKDPEASFKAKWKEGVWMIFFRGKSGKSGDHFSVFVDDKNAEAKLSR